MTQPIPETVNPLPCNKASGRNEDKLWGAPSAPTSDLSSLCFGLRVLGFTVSGVEFRVYVFLQP